MKKFSTIGLLSGALLIIGLIVSDSTTADPGNPDLAYVCGSYDNGVKKGPDENGKVSIKCFEPKGEWKNDGKGNIQCKGILANSPGLVGAESCTPV